MTTKKIITKIAILSLLFIVLILPQKSKANTTIYNIETSNLKDNQATLNCNTSQESRVYVFFGKNADKLNLSVGSSLYKKHHNLVLTGLESDSAYYYKIVAYSENGEESESFIRYLDTEKMKDTIRPEVLDFEILQTTNKATNFIIKSNEKVRVSIKYGIEETSLNKSWSTNSYRTNHDIIITKLIPEKDYYFKITIKDEQSNSTTINKRINTRLSGSFDKLIIQDLTPESYEQAQLMPKTAIITWKTNVLAESKIYYGTNPEKLNKSKKINSKSINHRAILENLEPNTIYYFKIEANSKLNSKTTKTNVHSFRTLPLTEDYLNLYFKSGDIVKANNKKASTYLIYENKKIPFSGNSLKKIDYNKDLKTISNTDLKAYENYSGYFGKFYSGQVVKTSTGSTVYVIDEKYKRPIANWLVFKYLNYQNKDIIIASEKDLKDYKTGELVTHSNQLTTTSPLSNQSLVKSPEGSTIYKIANGKKLPFFSEEAFTSKGYNFSQVKIVDWYLLANTPTGQVIIK